MLQSEGRILFTRFLSATLPKSSFGPRASQSRHQHKKSHLLGFVSIQYRWCGLLAKECAESITALVTDLDFELRLAEHFKPNHLNGPQLGPSADADAARTGDWALQLGDGGWDTADRRHLPPPVLSKCQPHSLVFHYDSAIGGHTWTGKYLQELSNASPMWSQLRIEIQIEACEREKWVSKEALTSLYTLTLRTNVQVQGDFITNDFRLPLYFKNYKKR